VSEKDKSDRPTRADKRRIGEESAKLAHELMGLSESAVARLKLPEGVHEELLAARRITAPGARRRHERHLAQVLREHDADEVRGAFDAAREVDRFEARHFRFLEGWRDRLVAEGAPAVQDLVSAFGGLSEQELTELMTQAQRERASGSPKGAGKSLFRRLGELLPREEP
jgi:ribosome-associated protein